MIENILKIVRYIDTHIEMEDDHKKYQLEHGEVPGNINTTTQQSNIEQQEPQPNTKPRNGGLVRQPVKDGGGYTHFEWVFAGNAKKAQDGGEWSDTCDATADPKVSLGSNNMVVEAKLRKHKDKLDYKEPERRGGARQRRGR